MKYGMMWCPLVLKSEKNVPGSSGSVGDEAPFQFVRVQFGVQAFPLAFQAFLDEDGVRTPEEVNDEGVLFMPLPLYKLATVNHFRGKDNQAV